MDIHCTMLRYQGQQTIQKEEAEKKYPFLNPFPLPHFFTLFGKTNALLIGVG